MAKQKEESTSSSTLMAAALLSREGVGGDEVKELLKDLLQEQVEARKKHNKHLAAMAQNRVDAAKEMHQVRESEFRRCNHRKQDGTTRLSGQRLTGTGQICLVCKYCGMDFFYPALEGQKEVPRDLWPTGDEIGG